MHSPRTEIDRKRIEYGDLRPRPIDRERALRRVDLDRPSEFALAEIERDVTGGDLQLHEVALE